MISHHTQMERFSDTKRTKDIKETENRLQNISTWIKKHWCVHIQESIRTTYSFDIGPINAIALFVLWFIKLSRSNNHILHFLLYIMGYAHAWIRLFLSCWSWSCKWLIVRESSSSCSFNPFISRSCQDNTMQISCNMVQNLLHLPKRTYHTSQKPHKILSKVLWL